MPSRSTLSIALALLASSVGLAATVGPATAARSPHAIASSTDFDSENGLGGSPEDALTRCRPVSGTSCSDGGGRTTSGGAGKVSHAGWPAVTGILWQVQTKSNGTYTGSSENDELLGHNSSDTINGMGGKDIIWGNQDPNPAHNTGSQVDHLNGGPGADFIYTSHGTNIVKGGPGKDYIYAYYGHGTIDCGAGTQDEAKIRFGTNQYKVKNCEIIGNFCAFGAIGKRCAKPGEKKAARNSR